MKRSNCLFFALKKFFANDGSYLVIRKSRVGWWPHFLWLSSDMKRLEHFVPHHYPKVLIPPPLFEGYVRTDDMHPPKKDD